jgi:nitrite reductase/ring-hydroxylating ferredoxin subunit
MSYVKVCLKGEVWPGEKARVHVKGRDVLLVNIEGRIFAYDDQCPHQGASLAEGCLEGRKLTCYAHCWEFDVLTGRGINPDCVSLRCLPVREVEGAVYVDVEEPAKELTYGG